jgi:hypothetical protein
MVGTGQWLLGVNKITYLKFIQPFQEQIIVLESAVLVGVMSGTIRLLLIYNGIKI